MICNLIYVVRWYEMSEKFKAGWPSVTDGVKSGWLSHAIRIKDEPYKGAH